jgi:hypothetical protein
VTYVSSNYISGLGTSSDISIPSTVGSDNIPVKEIAAKSVSSLVKSLFIPKSVTKIEEGAFANASALKDIYYEGTETEFSSVTGSDQAKNLENVTMHYESLGANTDSNGWQFFLDGEKYTIIGYSGSATEIVLPSEFKGLPVTKITGGIFKDNTKITSVSIPESIDTEIFNFSAMSLSNSPLSILSFRKNFPKFVKAISFLLNLFAIEILLFLTKKSKQFYNYVYKIYIFCKIAL